MSRRKMIWPGKPMLCLLIVLVIILGNLLIIPTWFPPNDTVAADTNKNTHSDTIATARDTLATASGPVHGSNLKGFENQIFGQKLKFQFQSVDEKTGEDDYMGFINDAKKEDLQNPFLQQHKFLYTLNNERACNGDVFIAVIVHSSPEKEKERNSIRETWGAIRYHAGTNIVPVFMIGQPGNISSIQSNLREESARFSDIVQGNIKDSYRNLTYKNVMGLHWVKTFCNHTKFVLKADDDIMVDVFHLVSFLLQKSPDGNLNNFMYCSTFHNQGPVRRPADKWFVTMQEYPYKLYPPYCEGFAYIISKDVVLKLYDATAFVPFYWIDDVYVTGFLALQAGVPHRDFEPNHSYNLMQAEHLSKHVRSSIFLLAKYIHLRQHWKQAWNDILTMNKIKY